MATGKAVVVVSWCSNAAEAAAACNTSRAPFARWLREKVPSERFVFRGTDNRVLRDAVIAGVGIGFVSTWDAERHAGLVQLFDPLEDWSAPLWLVTHVDLHRTTKVQTFLKFLKAEAKSW